MGVIYVGADVHKEITVFHVMDEEGHFVTSSLVPTRSEDLVHFIKSLQGSVHLTFEEGTQAQWLHGLLKKHVTRLVVCDPSKNRLDTRGCVNDMKAAEELADLLRCNRLHPVFHDCDGIQNLKDIERTYQALISDRTRIKNRLQAIFRGRGLPVSGAALYAPDGMEKVRHLLRKEKGLLFRAETLHKQLLALEELVAPTKQALLLELRQHMVYRYLKTIPGFGPIRCATVIANVATPHRFPTKRDFWSYCGFSVRSKGTGNHKMRKGRVVYNPKSLKTRGLTRKRNPYLKKVFKGAALHAVAINEDFAEYEARLIKRGLDRDIARVNVARKLATIALTIWKKGVPYNPQEMRDIEAK